MGEAIFTEIKLDLFMYYVSWLLHSIANQIKLDQIFHFISIHCIPFCFSSVHFVTVAATVVAATY